MLIEFNKSANGRVVMVPAKKVALIHITADHADVYYVLGQYDRIQGDYRSIEDLLVQNGFVKGVKKNGQNDHHFLNVKEAQKINFIDKAGCYELTATFAQDEYTSHNKTYSILTSRKYVNALYNNNVVIRKPEKTPVLAVS